MPFFKKFPKKLISQGIQYKVLFSYKQDSSKEILKAVREDKQTGICQEVLLKVFLDEKKSYQEEFESLSHVISPYCVRLFGFENFGPKKALVLEYINGITLFDLAGNFSLKSYEINYILLSIYKGLEDLNRQGVSHGDLSLNNVLIDEKANIKLIDFGKANYGGDICGTPPFVAPEILQGAKANFLSDLYSLGVIEVILRNPYPLSSLNDMKVKDFNKGSPLLFDDPVKRFFPYKKEISNEFQLKSLSYKVRDLLSCRESRKLSTVKNPHKPQNFFFFRLSRGAFVFALFLASLAPTQADFPSHGWIKIYSNEWLLVRLGQFQSYAPVQIPLKEGWYSLEWNSRQKRGLKKVFVSKGKALFLNDKSFTIKE